MAQNDPLLYRAGQSVVNAGKQAYAASDRLGKNTLTSLGNAGSNVIDALGSGYKQLGRDVARPLVSKSTQSIGGIGNINTPTPAINSGVTQANQNVTTPIVTQQPPTQPAQQQSLGEYSANPNATGGIPTRLGDNGNIEFTNADGSGQGSLYLNNRTPEENAAFAEKMRGFSQVNSGDLGDQYAQGMAAETNGKIMEAMRLGDITTGEAQALRARDFNAADKIGSGNYIKPDERPTDVKQAIAYGQNLGNFTRNGELNNNQALDAQKTYMQSLGGFKGVANAGNNAKPNHESVSKDNYDSQGMKSGQTLYSFNKENGEYSPMNKTQDDRVNDQWLNSVLSKEGVTEEGINSAKKYYEKINGKGSLEKFMNSRGA